VDVAAAAFEALGGKRKRPAENSFEKKHEFAYRGELGS
jgi:hypothetical protein